MGPERSKFGLPARVTRVRSTPVEDVAIQRLMAMAATLLTTTTLGPMPQPAMAQVQAGGQRCIGWTFVRQVAGVYDSSYVQYANRCGDPVGFFWRQSTVYQTSNPPACNAMTGAHNSGYAPVGWTNRVSQSATGTLVIVIHECPARTRAYMKTDGIFYCR
ncbi:hypothetical protein FHT00_001206 [Sphingomonas insulae]|uniref:Secreted protein n=1 Tax=Sphingomonas insulae TaxID=424800 RepID=A0ABN1HR12_9SPHN|nr:hypothetical protein [Sphingomonas insulae]NIJ29273.1 hypothetical protein [Sphingomonas insulae]